ncbi:hypothetical protein DFR76_104574 [Nocardia pseudobrasiliensis]|uniref:Uncharacterized protein n=2 Tax=Nocardia pseudobrasiliensis TaxID=45979 RepID=A0A370I9N4_9NOCA|nr:hypothetical protein DFR76_104574 [Nocardia pseudobrasiliensis]
MRRPDPIVDENISATTRSGHTLEGMIIVTTISPLAGLEKILSDLEAFDRDLHEHPELSFQEHRTAAEIQLNIRTFDPKVREKVLAAGERIITAEAAAAGAPKDPETSVIDTYPLTVNNAEAVARTTAALRETFGADHVFDPGPNPGSEDAGIFATAAKAPLCYWFFGILDPDRFGEDLHQAMSDYAAGKLDASKYPGTPPPTLPCSNRRSPSASRR